MSSREKRGGGGNKTNAYYFFGTFSLIFCIGDIGFSTVK